MRAVLLLFALLLQPLPAQERSASTNVVLILSDDQAYGDFGFLGNRSLSTPHLDAMSERGAWLSTFYVTPVCSTTRASLLSGRYHPRTGVLRNGLPMRAEEVTLAERLAAAGWATGLFGKWHLGDHAPHRAQDQGFEEVLGFPGGILRSLEELPTAVRYTDPALLHNGKPVRGAGFETDVFFDAALAWIERMQAAERPFFAVVAPNAPHRPLDDVPAELLERYLAAGLDEETARVHALVSKVDENVGKLFRRLGELGLTEETLVVFLSDNGGVGSRFDAGLVGGKSSVREGGIRTPLLAHWPGRLPAGRRDGYGVHVDLVPTVLEACGVDAPAASPGGALEGHSLLPLLRGEPEPDLAPALFFHAQTKGDLGLNYAVRTPDWKLVHDDGYDASEPREDAVLLFDMRSDPRELEDVAGEHADVVALLEQEYAAWRRSLDLRAEDYEEPPVALGTPRENPVLLTQLQQHEDTSRWGVVLDRAGTYDVRLRFAPLDVEGRAVLRLESDRERGRNAALNESMAVSPGAGEVLFRGLELAAGRWTLSALLRRAGDRGSAGGVWQAWVERRGP